MNAIPANRPDPEKIRDLLIAHPLIHVSFRNILIVFKPFRLNYL